MHGSTVGLVTVVVVLAAASAFALWRRRTDGRLMHAHPVIPSTDETAHIADREAAAVSHDLLGPQDIDSTLGSRATLVQFSTAFCQPCRATRRVLDEVAAMLDGVTHVEVDAETHLPLVRRLNVLRTPTVLVLDGSGRIVRRASGQPRKADVIAALGEIL
jgi:thiol-disulfide isomerase/thioredoxin